MCTVITGLPLLPYLPQRTNRMLISMVVVFGTCWLPLQTINFIADLGLVDIFCWEYHHFSECT